MARALGFLKSLPQSAFAFTYGSSYLIAPGGRDNNAQIDLVLCVEDAQEWHKENLSLNPSHYSKHLQYLGAEFIVKSYQEGGRIHYNPYIQFEGLMFKYGVISLVDIIDDLENWSTFYLAGRMQKPIEILVPNAKFTELMHSNYRKALITSAMINPSLAQEGDLYEDICQLSYFGDNRVDDPKKVKNIVSGNFERFQMIYRPIIEATEGLTLDNGFVERTTGFYNNLSILPRWISCYPDLADLTWQERRDFIIRLFAKLNSSTSKAQILHALKTTNPLKVLKYSLAKLQKSLK